MFKQIWKIMYNYLQEKIISELDYQTKIDIPVKCIKYNYLI